MGWLEKTRFAMSTGASTVARVWRSGDRRPVILAVRYRDRDPLSAMPGSGVGNLWADRLRPNTGSDVPEAVVVVMVVPVG